MKVHTIHPITQGRNLSPNLKTKEHSVGLCEFEINRGSNIEFKGGSIAKLSDTAAFGYKKFGKKLSDKIAKSKPFNKLLDYFEDKTSLMQAGVALVVAGVLRPATNLAMSNKDDREDAMYAASHAIASAVIGFIVSSIVLAPFDKAFKKVKNDPKKYFKKTPEIEARAKKIFNVKKIGARQLGKSGAYKNISKVSQMMFDTLILGIPKAMLTIALIPPILKYVFGMEKKPKNTNNNPKEIQTDMKTYGKFLLTSLAFEAFIGGKKQ